MLNEIREYEEYTYDLDKTACAPKRIKYNVLTKGLNGESSGIGCGIESILSIIARHFLFDFNDLGALANAYAAECAVLAWLGSGAGGEKMSALSAEVRNEIESIMGWYPRYIEKVLIPEREELIKQNQDNREKQKSLKKNIDLLKSILDNLDGEKFRRDLEKTAWSYGFSGKNDYKKLFIEKVVANASARGPLKRYYLLCKDPDLDSVILKEQPRRKPKEGLTQRDKYEDLYLRLIAAYLLSDRLTRSDTATGNRFVPVNLTELSGWAMTDKKLANDKIPDCFEGIELITLNNQQSKLRFDHKWFAKCGWMLVDDSENDDELEKYLKEQPGLCYWKDPGACVPLIKNAKY